MLSFFIMIVRWLKHLEIGVLRAICIVGVNDIGAHKMLNNLGCIKLSNFPI